VTGTETTLEFARTAALVLAVALGFFLPGYAISILLKSRARWCSAFLVSVLVLFHGIFWLAVLGVRLSFGAVLAHQVLWTLAAGAAAWKWGRSDEPVKGKSLLSQVSSSLTAPDACAALLMAAGVMVGVMLLRSALAPLMGADTNFRWDFLAHRMAELGHFRFYPPLTAADFKLYFVIDGIPPLVQFSYWWLYAAWGSHAPAITSIFVATQYAVAIALTYRAAAALGSTWGGAAAAAVLATSPLFYYATVIGQETGLTPAATAGTVFFLVSANGDRDWRAMVLAGAAAAVGALSREYGCILVFVGVVISIWRGHRLAATAVFAAVAMALAAPWYLRTWGLSGNPFYSNAVGRIFAVNPVYSGMLRATEERLALSTSMRRGGSHCWRRLLALHRCRRRRACWRSG
jgi:hypothetical protein